MAHKRSGNLRILVVDDEKTLVKGMKFNLENEGYEVECAYDGAAALELAHKIYRPGIQFKKSGVILSDIVPGCCHNVLFDPVEKRDERVELSRTIDRMNHKYGLRTVGLAVAGGRNEQWKNRKEHLTPNYLTDIDQIMTVKI